MVGRRHRWILALVAAVLVAGACTEERRTFTDARGDGPGSAAEDQGNMEVMGGQDADGEFVVVQYAGEEVSFGTVPSEPEPASGEPIRIGMINQEDTPLGSFPELRLGAQAAVEWINAELGGVGGRPIELMPCITHFNVEQSKSCAQDLVQADVVAILGGIDVTSNGSIPVLEQNGVPYVGGIPVNLSDMQSPISFQFSGGTAGAFAAFAYHAATELEAEKVAVAYGDYESIKVSAIDYGVEILEKLGVDEVVEIPFPILTTDFLPVLTKAAEGEPDAIFLGAADTACAPAMKTAFDIGIEAQMYLVGSCLAPGIADEIGVEAVEGKLFNVESALVPQVDNDLYMSAVARYGDPQLPAASAATVSFRGMMNLWMMLDEVGPDVTRSSLLDHVRSTVDHPSFSGHPFTCDGKQVPDLPSLCSPQQMLARRVGGDLVAASGWIDVPALVTGDGTGVYEEPAE